MIGGRNRVLIATVGLLCGGVLVLVGWGYQLVLPAGALNPANIASIQVVARDKTPLREVLCREDGRARWVPLERISPHLVQAVLASEDQRFLDHRGVDWVAMVRALLINLSKGRVVSGGSTVTMQLVRMLQPAPRTLPTKVREMVLAYKLEQVLTKEQILWQYLNRAPYGNGTFGIEAAAQRYLSKPASQLSLAESALLAALPRSPSLYNPYRHRRRVMERQRYILALMAAQERVTPEQLRRALREPIDWDAATRPFKAPHMVRHVLQLPETKGAGWIRTTLDLPLQERVETAVHHTITRMRDQGITNASVLVADNTTGAVLAYVGSASFFDDRHDGQVDGTLALRQPGSTIKPFTYALALEQGATPAKLLKDLPAHFATDRGDYAPKNYDGSFHGPVRLRVALGCSYNVPAVRTAEAVGAQRLLSRLRRAGFSSLDKPARHYGLGLTLGNGEVTLQELVAAYAMLARGGRYLPLSFVHQASTTGGRPISLRSPVSRQVFDRRVAHLVSEILADPEARLPAFGRRTTLDLGFPVAVKTGTSKDFRDNWTVGFTPQLTVGVWVGNFDGSSMENVSGISGAGPLWAEVMTAAMRGREHVSFSRPRGLVGRSICPVSGKLAGPHCGAPVEEIFVSGTQPKANETCDFHREIAIDRRNGLLASATCPDRHVERRVMVVYPPVYRAWAHGKGLANPPTETSPLCPLPEAGPEPTRVAIRFPVTGDRYYVDPDLKRSFQSLPLKATVHGRAKEVRWLVNGELIARAPYPYSARWRIRPGRHTITAMLPDGKRSPPVMVTVR